MRALIADGHPVFRRALAGILASVTNFDGIVIAENFADAMHEIAARYADLILLDLGLPGVSGMASVVDVVNQSADARVVVIADGHSTAVHRHSRICGVAGLIEKSAPAQQIERILTMVLRGGLAFPDTLAVPTGPLPQAPHQMILTPKQLKVLALLTEGKSNKQIAKDLDLSPNTVKAHVSEILRRLDVTSRAEAIVLMRQPWSRALAEI